MVSGQAGSLRASYGYTVSPSGQRKSAAESVTTVGGVQTVNRVFTYDTIYRLTNENVAAAGLVSLPSSSSVGYTLDDVGNRLTRTSTLTGVENQNLSYNVNDWLTTDIYDSNGNTTNGHVVQSAGNVSDTYDFEDRLIDRNNGQVLIKYDGDGNRVAKTVGGVTTLFLVDDRNPTGYAQVLEEIVIVGTNLPTLVRVYAYGHDLISQDQLLGTRVRSFYGYDGHGNVRYLTGTNGVVSDTFDYDAFGTLVARTGTTTNAYLYCGEQYDLDLELYFNRARYLNVDSGRFWTRDIFDAAIGDPLSLHRYLYAFANPIAYSDASGLSPLVGEIWGEKVSAEVDKATKETEARIGKKTVKKVACELVPGAVASGVYILVVSEIGGGDLYIYPGQSGNIAARYTKWLSDLRKAGKTARLVRIIEVAGGKTTGAKKMVRELVEYVLMDELRKNGIPIPENPNSPIDLDELNNRLEDPEKKMSNAAKKLFKKIFPGVCD
jgi:RHS repeat-associated protein